MKRKDPGSLSREGAAAKVKSTLRKARGKDA